MLHSVDALSVHFHFCTFKSATRFKREPVNIRVCDSSVSVKIQFLSHWHVYCPGLPPLALCFDLLFLILFLGLQIMLFFFGNAWWLFTLNNAMVLQVPKQWTVNLNLEVFHKQCLIWGRGNMETPFSISIQMKISCVSTKHDLIRFAVHVRLYI